MRRQEEKTDYRRTKTTDYIEYVLIQELISYFVSQLRYNLEFETASTYWSIRKDVNSRYCLNFDRRDLEEFNNE